MENQTKPLEILVVEDREENRKAANEYFITRSDVRVDFATNYKEALQKMQSKVYAFGIFDVELPEIAGDEPKKLGYDLAKEAEKLSLKWAMITSGTDHHKCTAAFVKYYFTNENEYVKQNFSPETLKQYEINSKGFSEITETPKTSPEAWKRVYVGLSQSDSDIAERAALEEKTAEIGKLFRSFNKGK